MAVFLGSVKSDKKTYRILTANRRIKYAGTDKPSFLSLEQAKKLVNYKKGEMIYQWDIKNQEPLWEIL
jgi:hypothetical protein